MLLVVLLLCFGLTLWAVYEYLGPLKAEPKPQPAILVAAQTAIDAAVRVRNELAQSSQAPGCNYECWCNEYGKACGHVEQLRDDLKYLKYKVKQK